MTTPQLPIGSGARQVDSTTWRSPNFSDRTKAISAIVVHSCEGRPDGNEQASSLPWLCNSKSGVSSNYYVTREGVIYCLVDDDKRAQHAGISALEGETDVNGISIGIELEHRKGDAPYSKAQLDALTWLCETKMGAYHIPASRVVSHRAVALPKGRKSDPTDWPEAEFRIWASALTPAPPPSALFHGMVLTDWGDLRSAFVSGGFRALKVVTAWGQGWDEQTRLRTAALSEVLVVRTQAGDPSGIHPYPNYEQVIVEVRPWWQIRPHLWVEIGNEPNIKQDIDPAGWAWHLAKAVAMVRAEFPLARIISPALSPAHPMEQWANTPMWQDAIKLCDAYGVHQYAHHDLVADDTGHAKLNRANVPQDKPWMLTEYGIHDPTTSDSVKGERYAEFRASLPPLVAGAFAYHLCARPKDSDQSAYALDPVAYGGS